ncbi:hypothetical protein [Clostridium senegalense]|nr:hypothetical protein [Clostridium senegalense]MBU5227302.1 hypothetical protein [Clostridium senegalense]
MNREQKNEKHNSAKKMIIDGKDWNDIMQETGLRLKDLKRIQKDEINPHF